MNERNKKVPSKSNPFAPYLSLTLFFSLNLSESLFLCRLIARLYCIVIITKSRHTHFSQQSK